MGDYGYLLLRYVDDIVIFCKFESDAQHALKRAKEILKGELKLKLSPEKTKIINARRKELSSLVFTSMEDGRGRGIRQGRGSGKRSDEEHGDSSRRTLRW